MNAADVEQRLSRVVDELTLQPEVGKSIPSAIMSFDEQIVQVREYLHAGDGGFQLNVTANTDLKGAVLASTDKAIADGKNSLVTATLTQRDLGNQDNYSASGYSVSAAFSAALGDRRVP